MHVTAFSGDVAFRINGAEPGVEFLLDNMMLVEVPELADWKRTALIATDQNRKSQIEFRCLNVSHKSDK